MVEDPVQDTLLSMIAAKKKAMKPVKKSKAATQPTGPKTSGNVINIMDTLRKSIDANGGAGKRA